VTASTPFRSRNHFNLNQLLQPPRPAAVAPVVQDDRNYLLMRAEEEEARAADSQNEVVRNTHLTLAATYRRTALECCPKSLGLEKLAPPVPASHLEVSGGAIGPPKR
jgi:hypothetical protein